WSIALERPDAISTELTARFLRVAESLEHRQAAEFARQSLSRLEQGKTWPAVLTTAASQRPLKTGQGSEGYTIKSKCTRQSIAVNQWPETLGVYAELAETEWPTKLPSGLPLNPDSEANETEHGSTRDITQFFWTAAGFYFAIIGVTLFWW